MHESEKKYLEDQIETLKRLCESKDEYIEYLKERLGAECGQLKITRPVEVPSIERIDYLTYSEYKDNEIAIGLRKKYKDDIDYLKEAIIKKAKKYNHPFLDPDIRYDYPDYNLSKLINAVIIATVLEDRVGDFVEISNKKLICAAGYRASRPFYQLREVAIKLNFIEYKSQGTRRNGAYRIIIN